MSKSIQIPDCYYPKEPALVTPSGQTPDHTIYLSNLDDQIFLRFSIKYLYLFKRRVGVESLKASLSKVLTVYYPLAGRLKASSENGEKLELDCNSEGALFAEACVSISVDQFLEASERPNISWRKLLYRVEAESFISIPPLVIQVLFLGIYSLPLQKERLMVILIPRRAEPSKATHWHRPHTCFAPLKRRGQNRRDSKVTHLGCGGMILCTAISHCLCDGIGTAQFLQAWAHITTKPDTTLPIYPFHGRHMLKPRNPTQVTFSHPEFTYPASQEHVSVLLSQFLQCQQLVPVSATFTFSQILKIKKLCIPSLKCTSFEALAAHVWRSWAMALDLPPSLQVKLLFSVNARNKLKPGLPRGFYGNGFVLACAESLVDQLVSSNGHYSVKLVKEAKESVSDEKVRSVIDLLEERKGKPDLSASLVISQWSKLGLEDLDFGEGRALHMGPLASEIYCIFLPVVGDFYGFTVLMSVPEKTAAKFEQVLKVY
ncbi:fatty alcohol:caffeoyl-CoA acyltransferase isoform X1 [Dendrobium catenatum]|uniref:fatty alcohol:caffeoyl-CoA acyltransferase isoform X1 n=1 Tax=Dendrobium catenatum TaxID=906689 RepID=UPI0009F5AFB9|nr:fatty alcohol:caffeoyl-CoA acyltransferase isoform X1 [Dendrobium catenatum]